MPSRCGVQEDTGPKGVPHHNVVLITDKSTTGFQLLCGETLIMVPWLTGRVREQFV